MVVHDAGINRLRLEIRSGAENSSDTWSGFHFSEMDDAIERIVNPLRAVIEADGEKLYVNVNYVAFTGQIKGAGYIHDDPDEYAEFILATYLHLQDKYGWVPDSW